MEKVILSGGHFGGQEFTPDKVWNVGEELTITLPVEVEEGIPVDISLNYRKNSPTSAVFSSIN